MKKYIKKITCGIIAAVMMFALVGCGDNSNGNGNSIKIGGSKLEDVIVGTWDGANWTSDAVIFRSDGSIDDGSEYYRIDENTLYRYNSNDVLWGVYEVEILSNDCLKLYEIDDNGIKSDRAMYMDRIS